MVAVVEAGGEEEEEGGRRVAAHQRRVAHPAEQLEAVVRAGHVAERPA